MSIGTLLLIIFLLLIAGFLAGSESALTSLSRLLIEEIVESKPKYKKHNFSLLISKDSAMKTWIAGARPRTLPAAIAPVLIGTALIQVDGVAIKWFNAALALGVGLSLQVAVNFSNDYSDGIRGSDEARVGPTRLVASGLQSPKAVKLAAIIFYALASVFGLILALATSPVLILVGAPAIL